MQKHTTVDRTMCAARPYAKLAKCSGCRRYIRMHKKGWKKTPVVVTEEQVSIYRSDVKFYHPACFKEDGQ